MSTAVQSERPAAVAGRAPGSPTRVLDLTEARWAGAATGLFVGGVGLRLLGGPGVVVGVLFAAVYLCGGWEPGWAGLQALRARTLDVDLLMVVAALGAAAVGQVLDGALLIVIFATSGALEALATARTADSVRGLLDLAPDTATRVAADGAEQSVPTAELHVGDLVLVRPGERIGADGRVLEGRSDVDQSSITGEPLPAAKSPGSDVFAGTVNGTGALRVRVERDPADSVIARIAAMVDEAARTKAATQLFIERIEQRYSVGMVGATLAIFAVPVALGAAVTPALLRAMTFMIVASPCAVVLATMPPLLSAVANAGRHGVLVKSAAVLDRLGQVDAVAFDKTGTLTEGTPRVTDVRPLAGSGITEEALLALAAAAEHPSEHPLGAAIVRAARGRGLALRPAEDFVAIPGVGVRARVAGRIVELGAPGHLLDPTDTPDAERVRAICLGLETAGCTAVVVALDGAAIGVLGIADRTRPDAARTIKALALVVPHPPLLLTGDNERAAGMLAGGVGITEVRAGLLPVDKVAAVREQQEGFGRRLLLVGDGVNDAPALAAAHVGIAMGAAGSDLALETADAVIVRDELTTVPALLHLARAARRLVVQNLLVAGAFATGLVIWDLVGTLPLPLGVLGHEGSTVIVGLNGLRLLRESEWKNAA